MGLLRMSCAIDYDDESEIDLALNLLSLRIYAAFSSAYRAHGLGLTIALHISTVDKRGSTEDFAQYYFTHDATQ